MNNDTEQNEDFANDGFAHSDFVIKKQPYDFNNHDWIQEGNVINCTGMGQHNAHGSEIPVGKVLVKEGNVYNIIDAPVLS